MQKVDERVGGKREYDFRSGEFSADVANVLKRDPGVSTLIEEKQRPSCSRLTLLDLREYVLQVVLELAGSDDDGLVVGIKSSLRHCSTKMGRVRGLHIHEVELEVEAYRLAAPTS